MKNKILFIDWYKTLSFDLFWQKLKTDNPSEFLMIEQSIFENKETMYRWLTGKYVSEDICEDISRITIFQSQQLFSELESCCSTVNIHPDIIQTIKKLQTNYHIIITTDNMDCFSRFTIPKTDITSWTDHISNSSDIQRLKNEENGKTFRDMVQQLCVPFEQTYCIDDTTSTCDLIRSLGGTALQTTGEIDTLRILKALE